METEEERIAREMRERQQQDIEELRRRQTTEQQAMPQESDILPGNPGTTNADTISNSYSEHGSYGGNVSSGESNQFGSNESVSYKGKLSPDRQAEMEARQKAAADAVSMVYDPVTGKLTPKNTFVFDILGVDPAVMRKKREEEQALNRSKQRESAIYNALAVLGDMITTAGGGNVWKRDADKHAKEAHDANMALDREQLAEDISNAEKLNGVKKDIVDKIEKITQFYNQAYAPAFTRSSNQGTTISNSTSKNYQRGASTQRQGTTTTEQGLQKQVYVHNLGNGGKGGEDYVNIRAYTANGNETMQIPINAKRKEAFANQMADIISKKPEYEQKYKEYITKSGTGTNQKKTIDVKRLIDDGLYHDDPYIMNFFLTELAESGVIRDSNQKPITDRAQLYQIVTGDSIYDHTGNIRPDMVMEGVTLNNVKGTKKSVAQSVTAPWRQGK